MAEALLDDRYTDGIWYDMHNGDFAEIQRSDDGELVELVNPETGDVYWDMPVADWETEQHDWTKVPEEAITDPKEVVNRALRIMSRNDPSELMSVSHSFEVSLRYARDQVEISEK